MVGMTNVFSLFVGFVLETDEGKKSKLHTALRFTVPDIIVSAQA